jgi:CRP-like cAMP-binding protein
VARLAPVVQLLGALDLFAGATNTVLERLASSAKEERLPGNTVVIRQGDDADALWVLVDGTLLIHARDGAGVDFALPNVQAPGYVGELGLLHGAPRSATVTTLADTVLLRIEGKDFLDAIENSATSVSLQTTAVIRLARTAAPSSSPITSVAE